MDLLTEKDKAVIVDLLKQNEKFEPFLYNGEYYKSYIELLMAKRESPLLEKLQARYGESYKKVKGKDPKDADVFFWDMINSNVLKEIYCNPYFTNDDLLTLISAITDIEIRGIDITPVNKRIDKILHDLRILENSLFNKIVSLQNDDERLEEYLKSMKITKDNYSKYIRERKYLDKKMKESLLLILSKHYKTDYVSLYDILEMIQISDETGQPLKEIVKERNIDYKYFINIYNKLAKERPDLFEIIKMADKDEINRLKIYSSIKNSRVHSIGVFKNKYKRTPEEVLAMFEDSVLFDEVFGMLSSWYEFEPKEDKDNQIKKNKSNKKATL